MSDKEPTTDPRLLRSTQRLHKMRREASATWLERHHAVRWSAMRQRYAQHTSMARCVNRGCLAIWIMDNQTGVVSEVVLGSDRHRCPHDPDHGQGPRT
jgi:hypothetical protein